MDIYTKVEPVKLIKNYSLRESSPPHPDLIIELCSVFKKGMEEEDEWLGNARVAIHSSDPAAIESWTSHHYLISRDNSAVPQLLSFISSMPCIDYVRSPEAY